MRRLIALRVDPDKRLVAGALRAALMFGLVAALGVPLNDNPRFLVLAGAGFLVLVLPLRRALWRYVVALGIVVAVVAVSAIVPRAAIEEAHNVYLYPGEPTGQERGLPPPVAEVMRRQFLAQYPAEDWCRSPRGCWLRQKLPDSLSAFSADSIWRPAKYSRVVDGIGFDGLDDFRGGFVNDKGYNWYASAGPLQRDNMPFFVMYELPDRIVGGRLCWTGHVLWEGNDGTFDHVHHPRRSCRGIDESDAGRRVFGLSILIDAPLSMDLDPPSPYRFTWVILFLLGTVGVAGIVLTCVRFPRSHTAARAEFLRQAGLFVATLVFIALYLLTRSHDFIFGGFPPLDGGNDGLTYQGLANSILIGVASNDVMEVLRGGTDVFRQMPGLPYFRALERVIFGDTNYLYAAALLTTPFAVKSMAKTVIPARWAWWFAVGFIFFPLLGELGLWYYNFVLRGMDSGFAEALATTLFFAALALTLRALPSTAGRFLLPGFAANLLFAAAVLCRPNYGPGAVAVIAAATWHLWRRHRLMEAIGAAAGFLPILFMLWHNYYFGGVFVPLTLAAGSAATVTSPPSVYAAAAVELINLDFGGPALQHLITQWSPWLGGGVKLPFLILMIYELARGRLSVNARIIAYAALAQHSILTIWVANLRFTYLAWALTIFALLGTFERWIKAAAQKIRGVGRPVEATNN